MSGSSSIVQAGSRFHPLEICAAANTEEQSASTMRIAASLTLGPLLFVEFCAHSYELEQTSISAAAAGELSLAQLSMRAFTACIRGMACEASHHKMSSASRVKALLTSATRKASSAIPSSKDGWNYYRKSVENEGAHAGIPDDELQLGEALFPFLSLAVTSTESVKKKNEGSTITRLCLISELLSNGMYGEAMESCHLIFSAAEAFTEPNMKEQLGVTLLRAWEFGPAVGGGEDGNERVGVLGLDHGEGGSGNNNMDACVSSAIKVAMKLNSGLDGNIHVPIPSHASSSSSSSGNYENLRKARSKFGLPTSLIDNWPKRHQGRLEKALHLTSSGMSTFPSIGTQIAWAIVGTL